MALVTQADLAGQAGADWKHEALGDLARRLTPPSDFPCTFSQNAFRRELLQFSFIDKPGDAGFAQGAADLAGYLEDCRHWNGKVNSAKPLLMIFSPQAARFDCLQDYTAHGWRALQYWHDHDPAPWPANVAADPETPFWSFCFAGTQLFVNMSVPVHHRRQSRNLGRHFTLVINPRERFDVVGGDTAEGRKVRKRIRSRAAAYDGLPHSPLLGLYQKGELEWVQYALPDDNSAAPGTCPFQFRG